MVDKIIIQGPVNSELLMNYKMDEELQSFRTYDRQKEALIEISKLPEGRVMIASVKHKILGYVTFHPPESFERWSKGPKEVLELGAIEVSSKIRRLGVGKRLLEVAFSDPSMENYIVVATEYFWHWDLQTTGQQVWEYRKLMQKLMSHGGLVPKDTDDEEILTHPANMLMVRYGKNISCKSIQEFEDLLFMNSEQYF